MSKAFVSVPGFVSKGHTVLPNRLICERKQARVSNDFARTRTLIMLQKPECHGSGMLLIPNANAETVAKLGCSTWPTWGCEASEFPWTYDDSEVCHFIRGDVVVTADGSGDKMRVKSGDIAFFPKGMKCSWNVSEAVHKHYSFGTDLGALE